jgi:hypothetical protein
MPENGTMGALRRSNDPSQEGKSTTAQVGALDIPRRLGNLLRYVEYAEDDLGDEAQKTLSDLILAIPHVERSANPYLVGAVEVAATALCARPQKPELARRLAKRIKRKVLFYRVLGSSPSAAVAFGLGLFFYLLAPFALLVVEEVRGINFREQLGTGLGMLLLVSLAGALGSIVSVMIRLQKDFSDLKAWEPLHFLFTGLFRPMVGMAFAIFVFAAFESGIIPVEVVGGDGSPEENLFYLTVAFLAGFSERFAEDIVEGAEKRCDVPSEHEQFPPTRNRA